MWKEFSKFEINTISDWLNQMDYPITLCVTFKIYYKTRHVVQPFPNNSLFLHVCSTNLLKTLWEKEKLLVTSNFSFSHNIFYPFGKSSAISSNSRLSSANSFSLEESKLCHLGKGFAWLLNKDPDLTLFQN